MRQSNGKDFEENYWQQLHEWFERGGDQIVANYLHSLDSSSFDPKAPPQQTPAFWEIVEPREYPRMPKLADALDKLQRPAVTTLTAIAEHAEPAFALWLGDR